MTARVPDGEQPVGGEVRACRVVVDGDEYESFLICLTCDPGREVCCGHHLAPHDEDGCHELVAGIKCACERRATQPPRPRPAEPTVEGLAELEALRAVVARVEAVVDAMRFELDLARSDYAAEWKRADTLARSIDLLRAALRGD